MAPLLLSFSLAFFLTFLTMPLVIRWAHGRGLVDQPGRRSSHTEATPSLGGIPVFVSSMIAVGLLAPVGGFSGLDYVFFALALVFALGVADDLFHLSAKGKLAGQLLAAILIVVCADIRLHSMYGLLGFEGAFPDWLSVGVSIFTVLVIMNAFNLIDGINGLAAGIGTLINIWLGCWFYLNDLPALGLMSLSLAGALLAFLRYNITPARIFMGDTGSLFCGTLTALLVIRFIDLCSGNGMSAGLLCFNHPVAVAVALLIVPLFDTLRVFITRILRGVSPFKADRRHIHHLLIDGGLSHMAASCILLLVNMIYICLALLLDQYLGLHEMLGLLLASAGGMTYFLHRSVYYRKEKRATVGEARSSS